MKKNFQFLAHSSRFTGIFLLMILGLQNLHAQIILNYKNYLVPPAITYSYQGADPNGVTLPSGGADMFYNYSGLVNNNAFSFTDAWTAETNPAFPTARTTRTATGYFGGGFYSAYTNHYSVNTNEFSDLGISAHRSGISLQAITGVATDSIIMLEQVSYHTGVNTLTVFPFTYPTSWVVNERRVWNLQISIASLGLDHAAFQEVFPFYSQRTVIGWGRVKIPSPTGTTNYISCLLRKDEESQIDSFYVNGSPASAAVLNILGLVQGNLEHFNRYNIKRKGLQNSLVTFNMDASFANCTSITYDNKYYDIVCEGMAERMCINGVTKCVPFKKTNHAMLNQGATVGDCSIMKLESGEDQQSDFEVKAFPNPSTFAFTLETTNSGGAEVNIRVVDLSGRLIEQYYETALPMQIGSNWNPGIYLIEVRQGDRREIVKVIKTN